MRYSATAERDGKFWIITVDGIGVTQALSVAEAPEMASGLVYAMTDVKDAEVDISFKGGALDEIDAVRRKQERAEREMAEASDEMRRIVGKLHQQGMKQSDIAALLKVSRQRASQLVRSATARPATVKAKASDSSRSGTRTRAKVKRSVKTSARSKV
ncbi:MAG TPA: hypothetical protein VFX15_15495 [Actinomycetes bacterium]|nr:hypothetical protein [Actinomycetes bacterium]